MKALAKLSTIVLLCIIAISSVWAQTSISGKQDIAKLMKLAESNFDLTKEDAVILFEGKKLYWLPDGRQIDFVHRIIWINSDYATESYGDHRIPYDSEHCKFHVVTVRTWMDNQWWETGETGIVPTTPDALELAYDYTNIQEMMLLHNGIELPCILEVTYYIEDKEPFRGGIDGIWTFAKAEPVIRSWFGYGMPTGIEPNIEASQNLPARTKEKDEKYNLDVYWWKTEMLPRTLVNHIQDPALDSPYLVYSTWNSWDELGGYILSHIEDAAKSPEKMSSDLDSALADALVGVDSINAITEYVDSKIRLVQYNNSFWKYSPRLASRTFDTAYGNRLDRTVLIMALLRKEGFTVDPIYFSSYSDDIVFSPPTTAAMKPLSLVVHSESAQGIYDPYTNSLSQNEYYYPHRVEWTLNESQGLVYNHEYYMPTIGETKLILQYKKDKDMFSGKGEISSKNDRHLYQNIYGTGSKAKSYLNKIASSLIFDIKVKDFNPLIFSKSENLFTIECEIEEYEKDDQGRLAWQIGNSTGGIFDQLPDNIRLTDQRRDLNIYLESPVIDNVTIKFKLDGIEIIYKPESKSISNECGKFNLTITEKDSSLSFVRTIELNKAKYTPEDWPKLREILLAAQSKNYNSIIIKTKPEETKTEE